MTLVPVGDPTSGEICMMVLPEATGGPGYAATKCLRPVSKGRS